MFGEWPDVGAGVGGQLWADDDSGSQWCGSGWFVHAVGDRDRCGREHQQRRVGALHPRHHTTTCPGGGARIARIIAELDFQSLVLGG